MLKPRTVGALNYLLYPVTFEAKPWEAVNRVMKQVVSDEELFPNKDELLEVIDEALSKGDWTGQVASVGPHHTEEDVKKFLAALKAAISSSREPPDKNLLMRGRVESGQPCPQSGYWFTPAAPNSRRHFSQGEVMPDMNSAYGATIWQWDDRQTN